MLPKILLIAGVIVLAVALRSFHSRLTGRIGTLLLLVCSFLPGWLILGTVGWGIAGMILWLLFPWLDLVLRVRHLRLPIVRKLSGRMPPPREVFPGLREFTTEIEDAGFEQVGDSGWKWEDTDHFMRTFYRASDRTRATLSLVRQSDVAFAYCSLTACRSSDQHRFVTSDYPFSSSLIASPEETVHSYHDAATFEEFLISHSDFLAKKNLPVEDRVEMNPETMEDDLENEMTGQVEHNLSRGLLAKDGEGTFRYSWKGLLFLWWQLLKEIARVR